MKRFILVLLFAVCFKSYGQLDYTFARSTSTYTELTSPTVIAGAWDNTFGIKLPFQVTFFKKVFDSLRVMPNIISFTKNKADFICMGQEDYYYGGKTYPDGSEISYLITGTAPNRIIKAQFKNLKAVTTDTMEEYYVNNQIWFYETTNKIELHFGPNLNTDINIDTYYFGIRDSDESPYLAMSGAMDSCKLVQVFNVLTFKGMSVHPASGTVFTYTPYSPASSVAGIIKPYRFTNTAGSFSFVSNSVSTLMITDMSGKVIEKKDVDAGNTFRYDHSGLSKGMYLVTINSNNQLHTEKIIVQ